MLSNVLRLITTILAFILGGSILAYIGIYLRPKTFSPPVMMILIIVMVSLPGILWGYSNFLRFEMESTRIVSTSGILTAGDVAISLFWDVTGTSPVVVVEWGILEPCESQGKDGVSKVSFWVKNDGALAIATTTLHWLEDTWLPVDASQYFTLTWDWDADPVTGLPRGPLLPGRSRRVELILVVDSQVADVEDFSFDLEIIASSGE